MTAFLTKSSKLTALTLTALACATSAQAQLRPMIYAEETIDLPRSEVWQDWTTSEGIESFFGEEAIIEMQPGGKYFISFDPSAEEGSKGNDYGQVLGYHYEQMLHVTWSMPPYMPKIRPHLTSLQIEFQRVDDDTTKLRLFHTGFGDTDAWDEGIEYFDRIWPAVLNLYKETAEAEAEDAE
ncbi:SRPBCC family protein [Litorimonas sp. WD9-15]|uniref:SRPBCC family protein n=1 Tax=Litorimonas sp. WD9-15 TaxID=3418716 RepID=UPI003CFD8DF5